ncbi:MAG TPA: hypothetical protein DIU15_17270, partial [Deltaproteobacteria bacterium]|nr:hypothetical protein [Deltaproteobacteria bacterium]
DPNDYNCDSSVGYADEDGDSYAACEDCDDSLGTGGTSYPGADELCDSLDNDCDGDVDEGAPLAPTWYGDADGDGYGGHQFEVSACVAPSGYVDNQDDCDDLDSGSNPGIAVEVCDGTDNNCDPDGLVDEGVLITFYVDSDSDGFGWVGATIDACSAPPGYTLSSTDCADDDPSIHPGALEICDNEDDNCNNIFDDGAVDADTWYADTDGDLHGDPLASVQACLGPANYVQTSTDCDDTLGSVHPGAVEIWYDGVDQDCSGGSDFDQDGDGADSLDYSGTDENDLDPSCISACRTGLSQSSAGITCATILLDFPASGNGTYWLDPDDDDDVTNAFQVYCDMSDGAWAFQAAATPFTLSFTGSTQTLETAAVATEYLFTAFGARAGRGVNSTHGGLGGMAEGSKTFDANTTLFVEVGGVGEDAVQADTGGTHSGGYNGGGNGTRGGSAGGGATDVRTTIGDLNSRILVAGGGGGCGYNSCDYRGGDGGGLSGADGSSASHQWGFGGSQTQGGQSTTSDTNGYGSFGQGGHHTQDNDEGGGGGGWYGGGACGTDNCPAGGGSSYYGGMDDDEDTATGVNDGAGYLEYIWR